MADIRTKDPAARKDYKWNWGTRFPGDPLATSSFTADPGVTVVTSTFDATSATAWIEGGTHGTNYKIVNHVTTAGGRTDEWTLNLMVRDQ